MPTAVAPELPAVTPPIPEEPAPAPVEEPAAAVPASKPDPGSDELQRLAALAMAELGDQDEEESAPAAAAPEPAQPEIEPEPAPEAPKLEEPIRQQPPPTPAPEVREAPVVAMSQPSAFQQIPRKGVTEPLPTLSALEAAERKSAPMPPVAPTPTPAPGSASTAVAINLNNCGAEDLLQIVGCSRQLAESIVQHRTRIGSFKKLEDLYTVPGMTKEAYMNLTGEAPPENAISHTLNEFLGFPPEQNVSLKDVTDRISCWPDVTGCVLSQSSGLSLVGTVPASLDKAALVAFAPRMFESINKSFHEIAGRETDELIIPTSGTSFHILRNKDLYLIILSRLPQMPDRHMKVARLVLSELSVRSN
jgi:DNA uptake protein ComE-like DNA-binding protein